MTNFQSFSRELIHRNFSVNSCSHFLLPLSSPSFIRPYAPKASWGPQDDAAFTLLFLKGCKKDDVLQKSTGGFDWELACGFDLGALNPRL